MEEKEKKKSEEPKIEGIEEMDYEQMKKILYDEILRRDKVIDTLKKENHLLLKTALKNAEDRSIVETKKK
jgi:hypothetical protein